MLFVRVNTYATFPDVVSALRGKGQVFFAAGSPGELAYVDVGLPVTVKCDAGVPTGGILAEFPDAIEVDDIASVWQ